MTIALDLAYIYNKPRRGLGRGCISINNSMNVGVMRKDSEVRLAQSSLSINVSRYSLDLNVLADRYKNIFPTPNCIV